MRVDVSDLQQLWYEDANGTRFVPDLNGPMPPVKPAGFIHVHSRLVSQLTEEVRTEVTEEAIAECQHPEEAIAQDTGIIDSHEGQECRACGAQRTRLKGEEWKPWNNGGGRARFTCASARGWFPDLVLAMTRPTDAERTLQRERWNREKPSIILGTSEGDHQPPLTAPYLLGLEEAIIISATSCERCMNALCWMYGVKFDAEDHGYPEMSESWKRAGTSCRFCVHLGHVFEPTGMDEVTPTFDPHRIDKGNPF